jgi:hypothetical protein
MNTDGIQHVELLRQRRYTDAVASWGDNPISSTDERTVFPYGADCLRAGLVERAKQAFERTIQLRQWTTDVDHSELGAADWLLGNYAEAVAEWKTALKCQYGDAAGNLTPGLLLYYSGIRKDEGKILDAAVRHIEKKLKTGWSKNWPAPLGQYLIGVADEDHVLKELEREPEWTKPDELCRWDFYRGVKLLEQGDEAGFMACMRSAVDRPDQITWTTEFVLARHELGETPREATGNIEA